MKPLLTSVRALRELATGVAPNAIPSSTVLAEYSDESMDVLVAAGDDLSSQRVLIARTGFGRDRYVPDELVEHRRSVLGRMASFAERARTLPLSLPRGWSQYKHNNLITFFAVPGGDSNATRWIAEVHGGERADVIFWRLTTREDQEDLEDFAAHTDRVVPATEAPWAAALQDVQAKLHRERAGAADVEIYLPALVSSPAKGWSSSEWMERVTADQKAFIDAPSDRSIRLRGPAGSGKTLALTLKAVREALGAESAGTDVRILMTTHSWALATQIQESIDAMGAGHLAGIDVFPLLEIADTVAPLGYRAATGFSLIGEDSYSGKQAQLDEIVELLEEFAQGEWLTYRDAASSGLRDRIDSTNKNERLALAWDLLIEFGSVMGPAAIFPGVGSELRYSQLSRAPWMMPLESRGDLRVVYKLYCRYMENLDARSLVTSDQVLADFLSYLETHAWNRARRSEGYDLIFVDEFHLFNPLERQVLHHLTRDVGVYPRVFMAVDPRQSPSEAFIGVAADETLSLGRAGVDEELGDVASFELTTVHRFTPQILDLVKHVHLEFPTLELGKEWAIDFRMVESAADAGPVPRLISSGSRSGEETDLYRAVEELYPHGRIALAVVDMRQWRRYSDFAARVAASRKFHVATITGRGDVEGLGYRRRGLVVAPAEYLAGMQFETVLVAGVPDMTSSVTGPNERTRVLSLLYLALSRAERDVRIFVNDENGGAAEVLIRASNQGVLITETGSAV